MLTEQQRNWVEKSYVNKRNTKGYKCNDFGMYIRYHRLMNHMTVDEMAQKCGVSGSHITLLELGRRLTPGMEVVYKICKFLNIDGEMLMKFMEKHYETP